MADDSEQGREDMHETAGAWAKHYYHANRAAIESVLRPFDVGTTQWYVLYELATNGPTRQSDLGQRLKLERATLSEIVGTLVRKGLVDQVADPADQRHRMLQLTDSGRALWARLPDPVAIIRAHSFDTADPDDVATTIRVLSTATQRLTEWMSSSS